MDTFDRLGRGIPGTEDDGIFLLGAPIGGEQDHGEDKEGGGSDGPSQGLGGLGESGERGDMIDVINDNDTKD